MSECVSCCKFKSQPNEFIGTEIKVCPIINWGYLNILISFKDSASHCLFSPHQLGIFRGGGDGEPDTGTAPRDHPPTFISRSIKSLKFHRLRKESTGQWWLRLKPKVKEKGPDLPSLFCLLDYIWFMHNISSVPDSKSGWLDYGVPNLHEQAGRVYGNGRNKTE